MASPEISCRGPVRLGYVEGYLEKKNEVIYYPPNCQDPSGWVVCFGGDMQDYKENMLAHRDNKHYAHWDLESTASVLHHHFPDQAIIVVKPSRMTLKTFSCYENFITVNDFGAPTYEKKLDSLRHLRLLLKSVSPAVSSKSSAESQSKKNTENPLTIIGFSKGCTVLNQFLYSFQALQDEPDDEIKCFVDIISTMYWLEGGHSGTSSTWVTDKSVLRSFSELKIDTFIHVTPYQVRCDTRPRIGKEEKIFRESLCRMNVNVTRKLHFESEPRSLDMHFQVLNVFK